MGCPNKSLKEYQVLVTEFGEGKALALWVKNGDEIPSIEKARQLLNTETEDTEEHSDTTLDNRIKGFVQATNGALREVDQIVVNGKVIHANAITNVIDRTIEYVANKAKVDTLPEEAAHIYVQWLPANSLLLSDMMSDIKNQEVYYTTYEQYKSNPLYQNEDGSVNEDKMAREAIGKMIAKVIVGEDKNRKNKSFLTRLLDWIKSIFTGRTFDSSYHQAASEILNADTSSLDMKAMKAMKEANQKGEYYFQLTEDEKKMVAKQTKNANPAQRAIIKDIYSDVHNRIRLDKDTHIYSDLVIETDEKKPLIYTSVTTAINGKIDLTEINEETGEVYDPYEPNRDWGNDFDSILQDVIMGAKVIKDTPSMTIEARAEAIGYMKAMVNSLTEDGSIALTQVIVADPLSKIAGSIDLLLIKPDGTIKIVDLKSSWHTVHRSQYRTTTYERGVDSVLTGRMSKAQTQSVQVNSYAKLISLLGYSVAECRTEHILVKHKDGKVVGFEADKGPDGRTTIIHSPSENETLVDKIVPTVYHGKGRLEELGFGAPKQPNVDAKLTKEQEEALSHRISEDILPTLNTHIEYLKELRRIGRIEISENAIARMQDLITVMHTEFHNTGGHSKIYDEFLKTVQGHINAFTSYIKDDKNLKDPHRYIRTIFMGFKYLDTFSHILHTEQFANQQQKQAFTNLDENIRNLRIILDDAITSHAVEFLQQWSNNPLYQNKELALAAVRVQNDLSWAKTNLDTIGNSGNPIAENASKMIATARLEAKDSTHHIEEQVNDAADALIKASGSKDPRTLYDFMFQRTAKGYKNGQYISQQGSYYKQLKNEVDSALLHEVDGEYVPKVFHQGSVLTPEQRQWNIDLYKLKEAQRLFNEAEVTTGGVWHGNGYSDEVSSTTGRYHEYKKDKVDIEGNLDPNGKSFEEWRSQFMYQDPSQFGQWVPKDDNDKVYIKWRGENYTFRVWIGAELKYDKAANKVFPTGYAVERTGWVPNQNLTTSLIFARDGQKTLLWDKTYQRIMDPNATELDKAQGDYYRTYIGQMRQLVEGLPAGVLRWFEQGNIPVIPANFLQMLSSKDADVSSIITKEIKDWFTIKAGYDPATKKKTGAPNQTLPIMFTGSLQDQARLNKAKEAIAEHAKTKGDKKGAELREWHKRNDELVRLMKIEANKITADQLHPDLSLGLKAFAGMTENFKALSNIEDSLLALKAQLMKTTYTDAKGNIVEATKSNTVRLFNHVLDVCYYDDPNRAKSTAEQVVDKLQKLTTTIFIPFNLFGAANNKIMARLNNRIDSIGSDFFQVRAYNRMVKEYNTKHIPGFVTTKFQHLADEGVNSHKNKKAGSKFEAMTDDFHMVRHLQVNDGRISFIAKLGGYAPYEAGEWEAQAIVGNAILDSVQMRYTGDKGLRDCSVWDAHTWNEQTGKKELIPGYMYLDNTGQVAKDQAKAKHLITNRIHETNDRIHGNYAKENKILLEREVAGRLILQFHKWIYPNFKQRYQKGKFDENLGGGMQIEGRWNTAWGFLKALHKYGVEPMERWNELTEHQRSNLKKDIADIAYCIGLFAFAYIVKKATEGIGDDDPYVKRMKNWLLYQSDRGLQEVSIFIPGFGLYESYQLVNNPFAATAAIKEFALTLHDMIEYPFVDDEHRYMQKGNHKGESHLYMHAKKAIPGINTLDKAWYTMYSTSSFYLGGSK